MRQQSSIVAPSGGSLMASTWLSDEDIAAAVAVGGSTVYRTKRRFVKGNLEAATGRSAPRAQAA